MFVNCLASLEGARLDIEDGTITTPKGNVRSLSMGAAGETLTDLEQKLTVKGNVYQARKVHLPPRTKTMLMTIINRVE